MKRRLYIMVLAVLVLAGCGEEEPQEVEVTEAEERTVALAGRTLVLDGYNGTLTLVGRKDSTVALRIEKKATGVDEEEARGFLGGITLEEQEDGEAYTLRVRSDQAEKTSVGLRAEVPYRASLRLALGNGVVEVEAMAGPIQIAVGNGQVRLKGAANTLDVRVDNGDLTAGMAGFRDTTSVRLETGNGAIELVVPASTSAAVEAETQVGTIEVRGLSLGDKKEEKSTTGSRLEGLVGSGSGRIVLKAMNGSILLRSGQ